MFLWTIGAGTSVLGAKFPLSMLWVGHSRLAELPRYNARHRRADAQYMSYFCVAQALLAPGEPLKGGDNAVFNGDGVFPVSIHLNVMLSLFCKYTTLHTHSNLATADDRAGYF